MFKLNTKLNIPKLKQEFRDKQRVSISEFLRPDIAEKLYNVLRDRNDWKEVFNSGDKLFELDRETQANLSNKQRSDLKTAIYANARQEFQYRYETVRVPDSREEREAQNDILAEFAEWMSSKTMLDFFEEITSLSDIYFCDAQATAFSPGHFLTGHDDAVDGKGRKAAYVMSLTPSWRTEWGGILLFHDGVDKVVNGLIPHFNTLNMFAVPQLHSVSEVNQSAPYRRYSITGWLRDKR